MNNGAKRRVGKVRFRGLTWKMNSELVKEKIGRENIVAIEQSKENGKDLDAQDVVFIHPDFDEIEEGETIPFYTYNFATLKFERSV